MQLQALLREFGLKVGNKPVKIDLLFGESSMQAIAGILLIEYQGVYYPITY